MATAAPPASEGKSAGDPLSSLKSRSGEIRWSEIRERASGTAQASVGIPRPELQKPSLPPVTETVFDQIDAPFGDIDEELLTDKEPVAPAPLPAAHLNRSAILPLNAEYFAPQPFPAPATLQAEETAVGPGTPLPIRSNPFAVAQQDAALIPAAPLVPQPDQPSSPEALKQRDLPENQQRSRFKDPLVRAATGTSGLKPLANILPHYDYTPSGADPYSRLCPRPPEAPADGKYDLCPDEHPLGNEGNLARAFGATDFMWTASNLYHNPLYFEDPNLERYGQTHGVLQPAASIGRFGLQLVGLPYQMALDPPCRWEYTLGWYRPQEICTPRKKSRIPLNAKAAATSAAAYTGLIFIFP